MRGKYENNLYFWTDPQTWADLARWLGLLLLSSLPPRPSPTRIILRKINSSVHFIVTFPHRQGGAELELKCFKHFHQVLKTWIKFPCSIMIDHNILLKFPFLIYPKTLNSFSEFCSTFPILEETYLLGWKEARN